MGFNGYVFKRIPYYIKYEWQQTQEMEFVWRPSKSFGKKADLFSHVLDQQGTIVVDKRDRIGDSTTDYRETKKAGKWRFVTMEIVLEILSQYCSRRSMIVCYSIATESPIQAHIQLFLLPIYFKFLSYQII
jgi:hypothetical protein